ncbi:MAG: DUF1244 domain-containing protein [Gammaproteobacteria bacterium]|nr:DUF1244 domain-containing protein [Gammaproteobacteria bacterium]
MRILHAMPYSEWKSRHHREATLEQPADCS